MVGMCRGRLPRRADADAAARAQAPDRVCRCRRRRRRRRCCRCTRAGMRQLYHLSVDGGGQ
jgi:hypothetical protein